MRDAADPVEPSPIPASAPASARDGAPGRTSRHWVAFLVLAAGIVIADQLSKAWVVAAVSFGSVLPVFGDYVRIWNVHNTGALFGLFRDQAVLFAALNIGVVVLIVWFHGRSVVTNGWFATLALGLLLGGAVGNLADRLRLGYVVDFVDMGVGDLRFYTYNVADAAISMALVLLILMAFWPSRRRPWIAG
jgi:signal peptidase II